MPLLFVGKWAISILSYRAFRIQLMTRDKIDMALREGVPFVIKMADGEKYEVTDRNQVALGRTTVVVLDKDDLPHLLPMLTMTGISYLKGKR